MKLIPLINILIKMFFLPFLMIFINQGLLCVHYKPSCFSNQSFSEDQNPSPLRKRRLPLRQDGLYVNQSDDLLTKRPGSEAFKVVTSDRDLFSGITDKEHLIPCQGDVKILVVPVDYNSLEDHYFWTEDEFIRLSNRLHYLFNSNEPGTFQHYYDQNSFGQFHVRAVITSKMTLAQSYSYYGGDNDPYATNFAKEAGKQLINHIGINTVKKCNTNGDHFIDAILYIHAGTGGELGNVDHIWSHAYSYIFYDDTYEITTNLKLGRYSVIAETLNDDNELFVNQRVTIGTMVHEFGHLLGLPDLYVTDSSYKSGDLTCHIASLMDVGSYNGSVYFHPSNNYIYYLIGDRPAPIIGAHKELLCWTGVQNVASGKNVIDPFSLSNKSVNDFPVDNLVYKAAVNNTGAEYWLIEYRRPQGYDTGIFTEILWNERFGGLKIFNTSYNSNAVVSLTNEVLNHSGGGLIWHINESTYDLGYNGTLTCKINTVNTCYESIAIEPADKYFMSDSYGVTFSTFWNRTNQSFNPFEIPYSIKQTGEMSGITLYQFKPDKGRLTFYASLKSSDEIDSMEPVVRVWPKPITFHTQKLHISVHLKSSYAEIKHLKLLTKSGKIICDLLNSQAEVYTISEGDYTVYSYIWNGLTETGDMLKKGIYYINLKSDQIHGTFTKIVVN